jgi:hypothetical protein
MLDWLWKPTRHPARWSPAAVMAAVVTTTIAALADATAAS